jgi:hypothetical protein
MDYVIIDLDKPVAFVPRISGASDDVMERNLERLAADLRRWTDNQFVGWRPARVDDALYALPAVADWYDKVKGIKR